MNRLILFLFLAGFFIHAAGQGSDSLQQVHAFSTPKSNRDRRMAVDVAIGYAIPLGVYSSIDYSEKKAGYASGGLMAQATFDWIGKKRIGIAAQYIYQSNPLQDTAKNVIPHGQSYPLGSGNWSNHYLMLGPSYFQTFGRFLVNARVMGGLIYSFSSNFNTTDPASGANNTNQGVGFAMQFMAGAGYFISQGVAIKINVNYLAGWPGREKQYYSQLVGYDEYKDPVTGLPVVTPIYSAPVQYDIKKVVSTFNPMIGLIIRF